jgi:hypothetical protein
MFNNVNLIGYFGSDAESRTTRNNTAMTVLSLATMCTWKNRETGERESQTTWHRSVIGHRGVRGHLEQGRAPPNPWRDADARINRQGQREEVRSPISACSGSLGLTARLKLNSPRTAPHMRPLRPERRSDMTMNVSLRESADLNRLPQEELLRRHLNRRCRKIERDDEIHSGNISLIQAVKCYIEPRDCLQKTIA